MKESSAWKKCIAAASVGAAIVGLLGHPLVADVRAADVAEPASGSPSLFELYKDDFLIGVAIDLTGSASHTPEELALIRKHFNAVTPENSMKPESVHPAEDRWRWETADRLVDFAQQGGITVIGHTLVWHAQTGAWMFEGENGQPVTRDKAIERLRQHIHATVGRYKGKIKSWDVVNEAISDRPAGDTENLRPSPWLRAIGPDYLNLAFKFAHEADPDVELYYNDYNIERGAKHQSSLKLLKRLKDEGVPIHGVGIQGHWGLNHLPYDELDQAIENYKALGLKVSITELDVVITGQGGGQLTPAGGPPATRRATTGPATQRGPGQRRTLPPPTPEQIDAQAKAYVRFFEIFQKHADVIDRVTVWGLNDARSWRQGQAPLLFDGQNRPKPALTALLAAKQKTPG